MSERSFSGRVTTPFAYDRSRLFSKNVVAPPINSVRDANWEHQQAAMKAGYNSVLEMAVDDLHQRVLALEDAQSSGCELVQEDDDDGA